MSLNSAGVDNLRTAVIAKACEDYAMAFMGGGKLTVTLLSTL